MKSTFTLPGRLIILSLALLALTIQDAKSQTIPLKPCLEHFTASTCPPCAGFAPVFRKTLAGYEGRYTIIRYQMYWPGTGDPYYFAESKKRRDYYTITGVPGLACNGSKQLPYAQSFSKEKMDSLLPRLTGVQMAIVSSVSSDKIVTATVTITPEIAYPAGLVTQIVVMEGVTTQNAATNGEKTFDHVAMGFMPNADGTVLAALVPGHTVTLTYTLDMKTTHMETANDLIVAAFIQNNTTKEIIQSNNAMVSHPFTDYQVALHVIDNDYNNVPGGKVFIPLYGEKEFGVNGVATYKGVYPGNLRYDVSAPGYDRTNGNLVLAGSDMAEDVMLDKPDIFYFEDFGWNEIPAGWSVETTNGFSIYGTGSEEGTIEFYKPNPGDEDSYLILPSVNLNQTGIFSFRAGIQSGSPRLSVGIVTLEAQPGIDGTAGVTVTGFAQLYSATVTSFDGFSIFGFPLPETIGNQRLAFRFTGDAGSFCELDQVAILEDNPGVKVQFLVTDLNDIPLKNTQVILNGKAMDNNDYGYATFRDTDPGNYPYVVNYKGQVIASGILAVNDEMLKEIKYNTSGVEQVLAAEPVAIYPNPASGQFTVTGLQSGRITVMAADGRQVMQLRIEREQPVSTESLPEGLYLVRIESDKNVMYRKVMISR